MKSEKHDGCQNDDIEEVTNGVSLTKHLQVSVLPMIIFNLENNSKYDAVRGQDDDIDGVSNCNGNDTGLHVPNYNQTWENDNFKDFDESTNVRYICMVAIATLY